MSKALCSLVAILIAGTSSEVRAQGVVANSISNSSRAEIDRITRRVTDALIAGDAKQVVEVFAATSPLMAGKTIELGALQSQIQTALTAYGRVSGVELVDEQSVGSSAVRRYYIARQQSLITRWEFVFAQTSNGWVMSYLGFDDQQRSWFVK